jgi:hypothetical protein
VVDVVGDFEDPALEVDVGEQAAKATNAANVVTIGARPRNGARKR